MIEEFIKSTNKACCLLNRATKQKRYISKAEALYIIRTKKVEVLQNKWEVLLIC